MTATIETLTSDLQQQVFTRIEKYSNARKRDIAERDIKKDNTLRMLNQLKKELDNFNNTVKELSKNNQKNAAFFKEYQENVFKAIIETDNKYQRDEHILETDLQLSFPITAYQNTWGDRIEISKEAMGLGVVISGFIGAIAGAILSYVLTYQSLAPVFSDTNPNNKGVNVFLLLLPGVVGAVLGAIVGAIVGGLSGLLLSPIAWCFFDPAVPHKLNQCFEHISNNALSLYGSLRKDGVKTIDGTFSFAMPGESFFDFNTQAKNSVTAVSQRRQNI